MTQEEKSAERVAKAARGEPRTIKVVVNGEAKFAEVDGGLTAADLTARLGQACRALYGPGVLQYREEAWHYTVHKAV